MFASHTNAISKFVLEKGFPPIICTVLLIIHQLPKSIDTTTLFLDNLFTSTPPFVQLRSGGIGAVGTTRLCTEVRTLLPSTCSKRDTERSVISIVILDDGENPWWYQFLGQAILYDQKLFNKASKLQELMREANDGLLAGGVKGIKPCERAAKRMAVE